MLRIQWSGITGMGRSVRLLRAGGCRGALLVLLAAFAQVLAQGGRLARLAVHALGFGARSMRAYAWGGWGCGVGHRLQKAG